MSPRKPLPRTVAPRLRQDQTADLHQDVHLAQLDARVEQIANLLEELLPRVVDALQRIAVAEERQSTQAAALGQHADRLAAIEARLLAYHDDTMRAAHGVKSNAAVSRGVIRAAWGIAAGAVTLIASLLAYIFSQLGGQGGGS